MYCVVVIVYIVVQGPAVSLADYSVIYTEVKRWLESKIKWFKDRNYPNNARDLEVCC